MIVFSVAGIYALTVYSTFFDKNKVQLPIPITANVSVDLIGAVLPLIISLASVLYYFKNGYEPAPLIIAFLLSLSTALLLGGIASGGLLLNPAVLAYIVSAITVLVLSPLSMNKRKLALSGRQSFYTSLFAVLSCVPLSLIIVDLISLQFFSNPTIGGNGLADGVLLSAMYSPLVVILMFATLSMVLFCVTLIRRRKRS